MSKQAPQQSLRYLIVLALLTSLALGGILVASTALNLERDAIYREYTDELKRDLNMIHSQLELTAGKGDWEGAMNMIATFATNPGVRQLLVTTVDRTVMLANRSEWLGLPLSEIADPALKELIEQDRQGSELISVSSRPSVRRLLMRYSLRLPTMREGIRQQQRGEMWLTYDMTLAVKQMKMRLTSYLGILTLVSVLVIGWVYLMMYRRLLSPMNKLVQFSNKLSRGNYGETIDEQPGKEFQLLSQVLNQLSYNLQARMESDALQKQQLEMLVNSLTEKQGELRIAATAFETSEAITITDAEVNIIKTNQAFTRITGYEAEEVVGQNPRILASGRHDKAFYTDMWRSLAEQGSWSGEIWNRRKSGEVYPEWLTISSVKNGLGEVCNYVASFMDITERKQAEEKITKLANYDTLTGLPNRTQFVEIVERHLALDNRINQIGAVFFIGLDHFKDINDAMGHLVGDEMLCQVAARLTKQLRIEDALARFGGDEFILMANALGENRNEAVFKAQDLAERLQESLTQSFLLNDQKVHVSASIGMALFPLDGSSVEELLQKANTAMFNAKSAGRRAIHLFSSEMHSEVDKRFKIRHLLRDALDREQLQLYLQPQIDVLTGQLIGAECLLRWIHPEEGFIPPDLFISIAETSNLIVRIDEWVLKQACKQVRILDKRGIYVPMLSVNISAQHFQRPNFFEDVCAIIESENCDPKRLCIEITEGAFISNIEEAAERIAKLREYGIDLSIDDFGTGYSSLSYLEKLPLDELKVDKSFMDKVPEDPHGMAITETVIAMANKLQFRVLAEGVETAEQLEFLRQQGCGAYQGYYYSRPLPLEDFVAFMESERETVNS